MGISRQQGMKSGRRMLAVIALLSCVAVSLGAQPIEPGSLGAMPGVHVYEHDGRAHKDSAHYEAVCRVVLTEFHVLLDTISLNVVFIGEDLRDHLSRNNRARFQAKDWTGAYVSPSLILMVGEEEADDTFMHEFMHYLQERGLIFANVPASRVHATIEKNEGLLLGSRSYLEYLQSTK